MLFSISKVLSGNAGLCSASGEASATDAGCHAALSAQGCDAASVVRGDPEHLVSCET